MDFVIQIALLEATLGLHGTFIVLHAMLVRWRAANLVPVRTVIDSRRAYLASHEVVLGSQGILIEVAKRTLATLTFLCLRTCRRLLLPQKEVVLTSPGQSA